MANRSNLNSQKGQPRVVVVWGPPCVGVSTVCATLKAATLTPCAIVEFPCSLATVQTALRGTELVLVDVDGGCLGPTEVQAFVDAGLLSKASGGLVRIYADTPTCLTRAEPDRLTHGDLTSWNLDVSEVEARIRLHSLNYFMIPNVDLEESVRCLATRCGLRK